MPFPVLPRIAPAQTLLPPCPNGVPHARDKALAPKFEGLPARARDFELCVQILGLALQARALDEEARTFKARRAAAVRRRRAARCAVVGWMGLWLGEGNRGGEVGCKWQLERKEREKAERGWVRGTSGPRSRTCGGVDVFWVSFVS